jgi:hypothetical protein
MEATGRVRFVPILLAALCLAVSMQDGAEAHVRIDVDLTSQTMHVRSDGGADYVWPISSGRQGHATPRGAFRPRALYRMVHSAKYDNAPMPRSIFFYGQFAIHGTNAVGALGRPASHGCIRLSPGNAATLFAMVRSQGAQIRILGSPDFEVARAHRRQRDGAESAMAYAPVRHAKSLHDWALRPNGR